MRIRYSYCVERQFPCGDTSRTAEPEPISRIHRIYKKRQSEDVLRSVVQRDRKRAHRPGNRFAASDERIALPSLHVVLYEKFSADRCFCDLGFVDADDVAFDLLRAAVSASLVLETKS